MLGTVFCASVGSKIQVSCLFDRPSCVKSHDFDTFGGLLVPRKEGNHDILKIGMSSEHDYIMFFLVFTLEFRSKPQPGNQVISFWVINYFPGQRRPDDYNGFLPRFLPFPVRRDSRARPITCGLCANTQFPGVPARVSISSLVSVLRLPIVYLGLPLCLPIFADCYLCLRILHSFTRFYTSLPTFYLFLTILTYWF